MTVVSSNTDVTQMADVVDKALDKANKEEGTEEKEQSDQAEAQTQTNDLFRSLKSCHFNAVSSRVRNGRDVASKLHKALIHRAEIEDNYAREINAIASSLRDVEDGPSSTSAVDSYASYLNHLASSHSQLAQNLREEVTDTLKSMISNHRHVWGTINNDFNDIRHKEDGLANRTASLTSELADCSKDLKTKMRQCLTLHPCLQVHDQKGSLIEFLEQTLQVSEYEDEIKKQINVQNKFRRSKQSQESYIFHSLSDMEKKRRACCKDSLSKTLIFELASLRNSIYEAEQLSTPYESINIIQDIQAIESDIMATSAEMTSTDEEELGISIPSWVDAIPKRLSKREGLDETLSGIGSIVSSFVSGGGIDKTLVGPLLQDVSSIFSMKKTDQKAAPPMGPSTMGTRHSASELKDSENLGHSVAKFGKDSGGFDQTEVCDEGVTLRDVESVFEELAKGSVPKIPTTTETHVSRYYDTIQSVMKGDLSVLSIENGEAMKDELSSSIFRGILLDCCSRILEDTRGKLPHMLALRMMSKLILWGLDWADQQNDYPFGLWVVCKAREFSTSGTEQDDPQSKSWHWPKTEVQRAKMLQRLEHHADKLKDTKEGDLIQWTMHRAIYNHRIWNRVAFWEKAFVGLLGSYQLLNYLERWWLTDPVRYPEETMGRYRLLFTIKVAPCLYEGLTHFPTLMQSYGIADVQIEHMIVKLTVKYKIPPELIQKMFSTFVRDPTQVHTDSPLTPDANEEANQADETKEDQDLVEIQEGVSDTPIPKEEALVVEER